MAEDQDEFYVGYLPMPFGQLRFVRIAVPASLWVLVAAVAMMAMLQRSPGSGVWETGKPVERIGVLVERPYPHIVADGEAVFLVEQGKKGAQGRAAGYDGRSVRVRGWRLMRDGREVLELVPEAEAIKPLDGSRSPQSVRSLGPAVIRGEIVDYKCFLGAMKPGDGKAHKACAILCMTGGIPGMVVSHDQGRPVFTLLASGSGGTIDPDIIELAGEPVEIKGELVLQGPLRILNVREIARR
jgi:hypothetical protein